MVEKSDRLAAQGAVKRDECMAHAALSCRRLIQSGRIAMIAAMLKAPSGEASIDDASSSKQLNEAFADGGKWRGAVVLSLVADGLIVHGGHWVRTKRPAGNRRAIAIWRLADRKAAERWLRLVRDSKVGTKGGQP